MTQLLLMALLGAGALGWATLSRKRRVGPAPEEPLPYNPLLDPASPEYFDNPHHH